MILNFLTTDARDILRTYREHSIRQSQKVVDLWDTILKDSINKLGDESKSSYCIIFIITNNNLCDLN